MQRITRQYLADRVSERWKRQYPHDKDYTQRRLDALPTPKDHDVIDCVIGNRSWTQVPRCDECGAEGLDAVVNIGKADDCPINLCKNCLAEALVLAAQEPMHIVKIRPEFLSRSHYRTGDLVTTNGLYDMFKFYRDMWR